MALRIGSLKVGNIWTSTSDIFKLLVGHLQRYPKMEIQDAYKLIYQAVMGLEHALINLEDFEQAIIKEYDALNPNDKEPLWESIHPEGLWMRINLRPLKARSEDPQRLATLCIWSLDLNHTDSTHLKEAWQTLTKLCRNGRVRSFGLEEMAAFNEFLKENNFPAVHHSTAYRTLYQPAYRIMRREFLSLLNPKLANES